MVLEDSQQSIPEDSQLSVTEDSEQSVTADSEQSVTEDSEQSVTEDSEQVTLESSEETSGELHTHSVQLNTETLYVRVIQTLIHFVKMVSAKKGKIISPDGKVATYVDNYITEINGETYTSTVHTSDCELLCSSIKCSLCKSYRANLRAIYNSNHALSWLAGF